MPRFPPPGPPLPRHPCAKPVPPSGSRRRAGRGDDDEMRLSNPIEEMRKKRERRLQELRIPQRMAEWDKRIQEFLPVAQARLEGYKVTRGAVLLEVAQARREALAEWHVKMLMDPLDGRFRLYLASFAEAEDEFNRIHAALEASREALRHFHQSLYLQATQALGELKRSQEGNDEVRSIMKSISYFFERDFTMDGLKPLVAELADLGLWKEPLGNYPYRAISPRGATSKNVRRALTGILFVRSQLDNNTFGIGRELHLLRRLRRHRALRQHQPEVFQYQDRDDRLYWTMYQISASVMETYVGYHDLRLWLQTSSFGLEFKSPFYVDRRVHMLFTKINRVNQMMQDEYHHNLSNITDIGIKSDFALQQTQLMEFQPILMWAKSLHDIYDDANEALNLVIPRGPARQVHSVARKVEDWIKNGKELRREIWAAISAAISWRGAANMCFGIADRPRRPNLLMTTPSPTSRTDMPRPILGVPVKNSPTRFPWQVSEDLYPRGAGIPIHFVPTREYGETLMKRFAGCKVLGIDVVETPTSEAGDEPKGSRRTPFDYLVLASDDEVAIFHLGWMSALRGSLYDIFQPVLGNTAILKVGVGLDRHRASLAEHFDIELEEFHDLTLKKEKSPGGHVPDASNQATLSSVVAQAYGSPLPQIDLSLAGYDLAPNINPFISNPQRFLTCLASRGYAALQLYYSACRDSGITASPGLVPTDAPNAAFGPVLIEAPYPRVRTAILGRAPLMRSYYIRRMVRAMVVHVFREHKRPLPRKSTYVRNLEAYYLFTSFRESLQTIKLYLGIRNPAAVIYDLAQREQLPLRQEDLDRLIATMGFVSASAARAHPLQIRAVASQAARKQAVRIRARPAVKSGRTGKTAGFAVRTVPVKNSTPPPSRPRLRRGSGSDLKEGSVASKEAPASKMSSVENAEAARGLRRNLKLKAKVARQKARKKAAVAAAAAETRVGNKAGGKEGPATAVVSSSAKGKTKRASSKLAPAGDGGAKGSPSTVEVAPVQASRATEKASKSARSKPVPAGGSGGAKASPSTIDVPPVQTSAATVKASKTARSKAVPAAAGDGSGDSGPPNISPPSAVVVNQPLAAEEASSEKGTTRLALKNMQRRLRRDPAARRGK